MSLRIRVARNFFQRLQGLLGSPPLEPDEALWIPHCQAIHTFGMRYPIDAVYLDKTNRVVRLVPHLVPNRMGPVCLQAVSVLELADGVIERKHLRRGDFLTVP